MVAHARGLALRLRHHALAHPAKHALPEHVNVIPPRRLAWNRLSVFLFHNSPMISSVFSTMTWSSGRDDRPSVVLLPQSRSCPLLTWPNPALMALTSCGLNAAAWDTPAQERMAHALSLVL